MATIKCDLFGFNPIKCTNNLLSLQDIIKKIKELQKMAACVEDCCLGMVNGKNIRSLLVGDRLYLTDDGTKPVSVIVGGTHPIETYMNRVKMKRIIFMGVQLKEMYMNGELVYQAILRLTLPQYTGTINLKSFIDNNNPHSYKIVIVTNNLVQPKLISGNTSGLEVTLINNGEFQGFSSGGDAMVLTYPILLDNSNGWIRGAGGDGGNGGGIDLSGIPSTVNVWAHKAGHDDGRYVSGSAGSPCIGTATSAHFNRFWKTAGGANSGAWINSTCADNLQEYWNTSSSPVWGDQGRCHTVKHQFKVRHGGGINLQVVVPATTSVTGGRAGVGGAGIGFRQTRNQGRTNGKPGSYSGPTSGFDNNGKNYNLPTSTGVVNNGNGGNGGTWATAGSAGTGGGLAGKSGGRAIVGITHLTTGSNTGNTNGAEV